MTSSIRIARAFSLVRGFRLPVPRAAARWPRWRR